jgi:hypothetical protein
MQELITIKNVPALVEVNFDELKRHLSIELERYTSVVVTQETVKGAKELATELNATKGEIGKRRKDEVARASAPVKAFDGKMKELEAMCEDGRQGLLKQVATFEDETRKLASEMLTELRDELWAAQGVRAEFRWAECEPLALLSAVTATGNLTAGAKGKLEALVTADKQVQDQTDMRLLKLENESFKSGLSAPLNRGHVEHFLFDAEPAYSEKLARLMATELAREEVAQQRMREKMDREQKQKEELQNRQREAAEREAARAIADAQRQAERVADAARIIDAVMGPVEVAEVTPEIDPDDVPPNDEDAFQRVTVACTFAIDIGGSVTDQAIEAELRAVLAKAGIEALQTVTIQRNKAAA